MAKQESKEETLRQLLIQAGVESAGVEFTSQVIKAIQAEETAHETVKNLVGNHLLETTSPGFEAGVFAKIQPAKPAKPILPNAFWYGLAAFVTLCLLIGLQSTASPMPLLTQLLNLIPLPSASTQRILKILAFAVMSFSSLLLLDHFLRQKHLTLPRQA
ncbi:hypothetical protein GCM10027347_50270 [Larkinella harenae]